MTTLIKNPDLSDLQQLLSDVLDRLVRAQEEATDPDTIRRLSTEIREVAFRATNVQQVLFTQQTNQITQAVQDVQKGDAKLKQAIAEIEKLNGFIKTISSFLGLVDKVVDLAKLI